MRHPPMYSTPATWRQQAPMWTWRGRRVSSGKRRLGHMAKLADVDLTRPPCAIWQRRLGHTARLADVDLTGPLCAIW